MTGTPAALPPESAVPISCAGAGDPLTSCAQNTMVSAIADTNQLTLSFQGDVFVFDSVSPDKVQAVLLLLGGRELAPHPLSQISRGTNYQRVASLMRFREKRKERNFENKVRYNVRKEVALRMQRNKGQFISSKSKPEDMNSGNPSCDASQHEVSVDGRPPAAPECHHCGICSQSTPMMRRGPNGPRTLCNACGLMWANKGALKDVMKTPPPLNVFYPSQNALPPTQNALLEPQIEGNASNLMVGNQLLLLPTVSVNSHASSL